MVSRRGVPLLAIEAEPGHLELLWSENTGSTPSWPDQLSPRLDRLVRPRALPLFLRLVRSGER
jgi:hypothetical protein